MKVSDRLSGFLAAALGVAVVLQARTFPGMPGQPIGPALFPALIGTALFVLGVILMYSGRGQRPVVEGGAWTRRPRTVVTFVLVIADLLFYALAVDRLGFLITAALFLTVLFLAFGVRRARILPLAVAVTFAIHFGFYSLLRVPLPWGVLEGIAW